jgi:hypothetical protein
MIVGFAVATILHVHVVPDGRALLAKLKIFVIRRNVKTMVYATLSRENVHVRLDILEKIARFFLVVTMDIMMANNVFVYMDGLVKIVLYAENPKNRIELTYACLQRILSEDMS